MPASHSLESGVEKPCYIVSATLSAAEKNYSQLDREALAVVFAIKKFHKFVFGYRFIVHTDHKPLESLLGDQKALSNIVSIRFHRWILFLSTYSCKITYRPGKKLQNADGLSRLPQNSSTGVSEYNLNYFTNYFGSQEGSIPLDIKEIFV